jgi:membrane protease YdiL (CAAX protease family)
MKWLGVFAAVALADGLWTLYVAAIAAQRPLAASLYSSGIILMGAFVTLAYVRDRRYLLPAAMGAFVGTYLSVLYG